MAVFRKHLFHHRFFVEIQQHKVVPEMHPDYGPELRKILDQIGLQCVLWIP